MYAQDAHMEHIPGFFGGTWGARLPKEANRRWISVTSMMGWCVHLQMFVVNSNSLTSYPLVNVHITMENHHFEWENPLFLWPFSIATLNYQRVPYFTIKIKGLFKCGHWTRHVKKTHRNHRPENNTPRPQGMSYSAAVRLQPPWFVCQIADFFVLIF